MRRAIRPAIWLTTTRVSPDSIVSEFRGLDEILAASDLLPPLTFGSLLVPGYGGRLYYPTDDGFITLQVKPS